MVKNGGVHFLRFKEIYTCKTGPFNESGDNNYLEFLDNLARVRGM